MQLPSMLQGESLKRLLQGAAVGAVATMFVGFYWGGWSLGSTADKMAKERSELAVVAALRGGADELLDGRIREVERQAVLRRRTGFGRHESLHSRRSARAAAHAPWHPRQTPLCFVLVHLIELAVVAFQINLNPTCPNRIFGNI